MTAKDFLFQMGITNSPEKTLTVSGTFRDGPETFDIANLMERYAEIAMKPDLSATVDGANLLKALSSANKTFAGLQDVAKLNINDEPSTEESKPAYISTLENFLNRKKP